MGEEIQPSSAVSALGQCRHRTRSVALFESSPATSRAIHASPSPLLQQVGWELPVYPVKCGEAGVCVRI